MSIVMDFVKSALPFVIMGVCIALICASRKKEEKDENYMLEGMALGMCLGVSLASAFQQNLGYGISLGMLIGETIGLFVKKKDKSAK